MAKAEFEGKELIGGYTVGRQLGEGAFGSVHHAFTREGKDVAIKVFAPIIGKDGEKDFNNFTHEAEILYRFDHRNIIPFLYSGSFSSTSGKGSHPFIVMQYANQGSLEGFIRRHKKYLIPLHEAMSCVVQASEGVQYSHDFKTPTQNDPNKPTGIIHQDLKPDNLLLHQNKPTDKLAVLVADFGVSVTAYRSNAQGGGTYPYIAPEKFKGVVEKAGDQYSLGVIAYELFTGKKPINLDHIDVPKMVALTVQRHGISVSEAEELIWGRAHALTVPDSFEEALAKQREPMNKILEELEPVVAKAIEKEPGNRYGSVEDFGEAVSKVYRESEKKQAKNTTVIDTGKQKVSPEDITPDPVLPPGPRIAPLSFVPAPIVPLFVEVDEVDSESPAIPAESVSSIPDAAATPAASVSPATSVPPELSSEIPDVVPPLPDALPVSVTSVDQDSTAQPAESLSSSAAAPVLLREENPASHPTGEIRFAPPAPMNLSDASSEPSAVFSSTANPSVPSVETVEKPTPPTPKPADSAPVPRPHPARPAPEASAAAPARQVPPAQPKPRKKELGPMPGSDIFDFIESDLPTSQLAPQTPDVNPLSPATPLQSAASHPTGEIRFAPPVRQQPENPPASVNPLPQARQQDVQPVPAQPVLPTLPRPSREHDKKRLTRRNFLKGAGVIAAGSIVVASGGVLVDRMLGSKEEPSARSQKEKPLPPVSIESIVSTERQAWATEKVPQPPEGLVNTLNSLREKGYQSMEAHYLPEQTVTIPLRDPREQLATASDLATLNKETGGYWLLIDGIESQQTVSGGAWHPAHAYKNDRLEDMMSRLRSKGLIDSPKLKGARFGATINEVQNIIFPEFKKEFGIDQGVVRLPTPAEFIALGKKLHPKWDNSENADGLPANNIDPALYDWLDGSLFGFPSATCGNPSLVKVLTGDFDGGFISSNGISIHKNNFGYRPVIVFS